MSRVRVSFVQLEIPEGVAGLTAVGASLATPYTVRDDVGRSLALPATVRRPVGQILAVPSKVRTLATRTLAVPYKVNARVGQSLAVPYKVRSLAGRSLATPSTVRALAIRSRAAVHRSGAREPSPRHPVHLRSQAGRSVALAYGVAGITGKSLALTFGVSGPLVAVGRSLATTYAVRRLAGVSVALPHLMKRLAGQSLLAPYRVRVLVARSLAMPSTVRVLVTRSLAAPYTIRVATGRTLSQSYSLRGLAGRSLSVTYAVAAVPSAAGPAARLYWIEFSAPVGGTVGRSLPLPHPARRAATASLVLSYSVLPRSPRGRSPCRTASPCSPGRASRLRTVCAGADRRSLALPYSLRRGVGQTLCDSVRRSSAGGSCARAALLRARARRSVAGDSVLVAPASRGQGRMKYDVIGRAAGSLALPYGLAGPRRASRSFSTTAWKPSASSR